MITTVIGDMLADRVGQEDVHILVHGCNAQGHMRSGIAKILRDKWSIVFDEYKAYEKEHGLPLGSISVVEVAPNTFVVNAITQQYYRGFQGDFYQFDNNRLYVDYDAIEAAFTAINKVFRDSPAHKAGNITVNFPLIGCGLANGEWDIVAERIELSLDDTFKKVLWKLP